MATSKKKQDDEAPVAAPTVEELPVTVPPEPVEADATPNTYHEQAAVNGCVGG